MKTLPALLFALLITGVVGVTMMVIGGNALFNQNTVPLLNSPAVTAASVTTSTTTAADQQSVEQLQQLVAQYQQREQDYQSRLSQAAQMIDQANQQLSQANQTIQSYDQLLSVLQQRGLIRIDNNGQIFIARGRGDN